MSLTTPWISLSVRTSPSIFFLMERTLSGLGENTTSTSSPSFTLSLLATELGTRTSPTLTNASDVRRRTDISAFPLDTRTRSFSLTPISAQSAGSIPTAGEDAITSTFFTFSFIWIPTSREPRGALYGSSHTRPGLCPRRRRRQPGTSPWPRPSRLPDVLRHLLPPVSAHRFRSPS